MGYSHNAIPHISESDQVQLNNMINLTNMPWKKEAEREGIPVALFH